MDAFKLVKPQESIYSPNYTFAFKFENEHDYRKTAGWMKDNWHTSFYYAAAYITFIFVGRIYMSTRTTPLNLKLPLTIWNIALAIFSITGTIRTWPEMYHVLNKFGFAHSVCSNTFHKEVSQKKLQVEVDSLLITLLPFRWQSLASGPGCSSFQRHPN